MQADLILFHPYDRWGFSDLGPAVDDHLVRYVVRRLAGFAHVWFSLANEYDLMFTKSTADWVRIGELVAAEDPHGHLVSIHNCVEHFDHAQPWVTHASVQGGSGRGDRHLAGTVGQAGGGRRVRLRGRPRVRLGQPQRRGAAAPVLGGSGPRRVRRARRDLLGRRRRDLVVQGRPTGRHQPRPDRLPGRGRGRIPDRRAGAAALGLRRALGRRPGSSIWSAITASGDRGSATSCCRRASWQVDVLDTWECTVTRCPACTRRSCWCRCPPSPTRPYGWWRSDAHLDHPRPGLARHRREPDPRPRRLDPRGRRHLLLVRREQGALDARQRNLALGRALLLLDRPVQLDRPRPDHPAGRRRPDLAAAPGDGDGPAAHPAASGVRAVRLLDQGHVAGRSALDGAGRR